MRRLEMEKSNEFNRMQLEAKQKAIQDEKEQSLKLRLRLENEVLELKEQELKQWQLKQVN